jgi:hypothetical protein
MFPTVERTAFNYLIGPLVMSFNQAFRQTGRPAQPIPIHEGCEARGNAGGEAQEKAYREQCKPVRARSGF